MAYIYVATNNNPEYSKCVKIGYTTNLNNRVSALRNEEKCDFYVYSCLEVPENIKGYHCPDRDIHFIIDELAPGLRAQKNKEYYYMSTEEATKILESIGKVYHSKIIFPYVYLNKRNNLSYEIDDCKIKEKLKIDNKTDIKTAFLGYMKTEFGPDISRAFYDHSEYCISTSYGDIFADGQLLAISNLPHNEKYKERLISKAPDFWINLGNLRVVLPNYL